MKKGIPFIIHPGTHTMMNNQRGTVVYSSFVPAGVYAGVMTEKKWLGSRKVEQWDAFIETCPKHAKIVDKVPNWARRNLGMNTLGRVPAAFPLALQHVTDEILLQKLQIGMELSPAGISDLIGTLVLEYNHQVEDVNELIEDYNQTAEETAQKVKLATTKITSGNLQKLAARFALRFGWGRYRNEKPSKHLDFNDHQVVAIRQWIKTAIQKKRIDERLIANFDQVWTLTYEPLAKVAWKSAAKQGERPDVLQLPRRARMMELLRAKAGLLPPNLESNMKHASFPTSQNWGGQRLNMYIQVVFS